MTQWGLDTLFNPAKRHMDEEKRRLQSTREQIGDNSGGRRIDLESGKVVIRRTDEDEDGSDAEDTEARPDTRRRGRRTAGKGAAKDAERSGSKDAAKGEQSTQPEPSAAAVRAAERRKRRPS